MKNLFVIGAGGFGREAAAWAAEHPDCGVSWRVAGFLDDNPDALRGFDCPERIVGPLRGHAPDPEALYLCGLGMPESKRAVCGPLAERGARFLTLVHPRAVVGPRVTLGEGTIVCPGVVLSCDIRIGRLVTLNLNATAGHDVEIGDFSTLSAHADAMGFVKIGAGVFLGSRAGIVPSKRVGDGAHVGAGSTVIADVNPGVRVFGVPARPY